MAKKYNPPDSDYSLFCRVPNCNKKSFLCKCGKMGHPSFYKSGKENMVPVIQHGHFLPNMDIGRNVNHRVGEPRYCPKEMRVVYEWRLIQNADRWDKIPEEQKKAMGWE